MKALSASLEVPSDRLIWLCEGLSWTYPDAKEYKRALSAAKGAKRLAMSGEFEMAVTAVGMAEHYLAGMSGREAVLRKTGPLRKALMRQMGESL